MSALKRELARIASCCAAYRAALAEVRDELDEIDREVALLRHSRAQVVEQPLGGWAVIGEVES